MERKEGKHVLFRSFSKYAFLNILGMIGLSCYILADTYFISARLGAPGLAALNLVLPVYSCIHASGLMIGIGGATRYALDGGAEGKAPAVFGRTAGLGLLFGLVCVLVGLTLHRPIVHGLGAYGEMEPLADVYLQTILCFAPLFVLNNIVLAFVRNDGSPQLSMCAMLTGSFSNILLDYLFMYPLEMGMFGAALATGLAPAISLTVLSIHFVKGPGRLLPRLSLPGFRTVKDCGRLGGAAFVNEMSSGVVLFVFNRVILNISGETGVAAYGVVANLALVAMSIFTGLCQGSQPLISRFHGLGDDHREKAVRRYALVSSFVLGSAVTVLALCFPVQLTALFNSAGDAQLAQIAERGIRLYFLGFPLAGINLAAAICLAASEHGTFSFTLALARGCVVILPVTLILSGILGMDGVWLSFPVTEAITLVYAFLLLRITKKPVSQNLPDHRRIS